MFFEILKKLVAVLFAAAIILLFYCALTWTDHHYSNSFSHLAYPSPVYPKTVEKVTPNVSVKFRIILDNKLAAEEDFSQRPQNTVFKQLRGNVTVKVQKDDIGVLEPISSEGSLKEFSLAEIFRPTISATDKILFMYVFQKFADLCSKHNIIFFIYDGSLMGSYRHHGFIPWDDDIDVFVNSSQKQLLAREGSKLPGFKVYTEKRFQWKFYHKDISTSIDGKSFKWPYIDIFFWKVSSTEVYDYTRVSKGKAFKKSLVFPLKPRPYEGSFLMAPFKTEAFLRERYKPEECQTNTYSHLYEVSNAWYHKVPCEKLEKFYPFVKHVHIISCKEHLYHKGKLIGEFKSEGC